MRATACTDASLLALASFCPEIEWIAHADLTGRPKFTEQALKSLKNGCIQRVIC